MNAAEIDIIAPNFKRLATGVTSTIVQLVPLQRRMGQRIAALGPGLPDGDFPTLRWRDLRALRKPPNGRRFRVWHARRNNEMLAGLILRDRLGFPLKLVFTSAAQRDHSAWTKRLIGKMDAVIATSDKAAGYLERPATVIMHGIDLERFEPAPDRGEAKVALELEPDRKLVGFIGRVRSQKGTDLFVDAMIASLGARTDWDAVIVGLTTPGHRAFQAELAARIATAGLTGRIRFVGEQGDVAPWFQALDLYVAPQRWEGFGLTPLEAMACACPVVVADAGTFAEQLDPVTETGLLVAREDIAALTEAVAAFMDNDARREEAGQAARRRVESGFDLRREAEQIGAIYETLLTAG